MSDYKTSYVELAKRTPGVLYEPLSRNGNERIAILTMHSDEDYLSWITAPELAKRGYTALNANVMAKEGINANLNGISAALAAMISVPIALPCTCIVWYLKKTQTGYTAKVQGTVYAQVADKEVECKKQLMQTQHDLKLSDIEANRANIQRVDSMTSGAFNAMDSNLKTAMADATAQIKKEG